MNSQQPILDPTARRSATDIISGGFLLLLIGLTLLFPTHIPNATRLLIKILAASILFFAAVFMARRCSNKTVSTTLHATAVLGLFAFLFGAMEGFQHVLVRGWMDDWLLAIEHRVVGIDISVAMQRWVAPPLTEWMMFSYMIYVPLLPAMAWLCYRSGGADATHDYILHIAMAFGVCFAGFILFPVASPLFHEPQAFTIPLRGWFFTWTSEALRHNVHYAGGSLPSPHCAAGTIILVMLHRYQRRLFFVALPVVLTLYLSTVYGRFHYIEDGIAGILAAFVVVRFAPATVNALDQLRINIFSSQHTFQGESR